MRITYDPLADAMYISLRESAGEVLTKCLDEDINLDLDADDHIVGVEILNASKRAFENGAFSVEVEQFLPQAQPA